MKSRTAKILAGTMLAILMCASSSATYASSEGVDHAPRSLTDQEIMKIAAKNDPSLLGSLNPADLKRLNDLSVVDPSKTSTTGSVELASVEGRTPTGAEISAFNASTATEQASAISPKEISEMLTTSVVAAATKCLTYTQTIESKNVLGMGLWRHWIQVYYCHNGSTLSTMKLSTWGKTYFVGWTFEGTKTKQSAYNSTKSVGYNYVQNHFRYAVFQVGTIQNVYPCLHAQVSSNGGALGWGTGCGLRG